MSYDPHDWKKPLLFWAGVFIALGLLVNAFSDQKSRRITLSPAASLAVEYDYCQKWPEACVPRRN